MDNHPIPQNVTGFEFKLIGEMTLKQFIYLAIAALFSYFIYLFPIPFAFKFPPMLVIGIFGFALAFVPISGRPFDKMIANFTKAVLSQDQYIYLKPDLPQVLEPQAPNPHIPTHLPLPAPKHQTLPQTPIPVQKEALQQPFTEPSSALFPPTPPLQNQVPSHEAMANLINGVVRDERGVILPSIIVEVKDKEGVSQRAFKTNKLGQFQSSTPLPNGEYLVELEDPMNRFQFGPISINLTGGAIAPLDIRPLDKRDELRKALFQVQ